MNFIENFLNQFEPVFQDLLEKYQVKHDIILSDYDKELFKYSLTYNFIKSFIKYTSDNDVLVSFEFSYPEIYCIIERNGIEYFLNVEVILAGGYNIQTLHHRFLTKTNLKTANNTFTILKEIKDNISKITKNQKNLQLIEKLESYIAIENSKTYKDYYEKKYEEYKSIIDKGIAGFVDIAGVYHEPNPNFAIDSKLIDSEIEFNRIKNVDINYYQKEINKIKKKILN